jgi:hypothetical protein
MNGNYGMVGKLGFGRIFVLAIPIWLPSFGIFILYPINILKL